MKESERERFLSVVAELYSESGKTSVLKVTGMSMRPIFLDGESILVDHTFKDLHIGDIGIFRQNDSLIVHRVLFKERDGEKVVYRSKGDWVLPFDAPIGSEAVIGRVVSFTRGRKQYDCARAASRVYAKIMALYSIGIAVDGKVAYVLDRTMRFFLGREASGNDGKGKKEIRVFRDLVIRIDRMLLMLFHTIFFRLFNKSHKITLIK